MKVKSGFVNEVPVGELVTLSQRVESGSVEHCLHDMIIRLHAKGCLMVSHDVSPSVLDQHHYLITIVAKKMNNR